MKIQFDPNLDYQQEAIKSVTDIFEGQEVCTSNFSVPSFDNNGLYNNETELGYGNKLHLLDDERAYFYKMFPIVNTLHSQLNWSQGGDCGKN